MHPQAALVNDLTLGRRVCAGCLAHENPEPDSIVGREIAARETGTPGLIAAIEDEYKDRGETLSPGMYRWFLSQNTDTLKLELDRLRAVGESP